MPTRRDVILGFSSIPAAYVFSESVHSPSVEDRFLEDFIGEDDLNDIGSESAVLDEQGHLLLSPQARADLTKFAHAKSTHTRVRLPTKPDRQIATLLVFHSARFRGTNGRMSSLDDAVRFMSKSLSANIMLEYIVFAA